MLAFRVFCLSVEREILRLRFAPLWMTGREQTENASEISFFLLSTNYAKVKKANYEKVKKRERKSFFHLSADYAKVKSASEISFFLLTPITRK